MSNSIMLRKGFSPRLNLQLISGTFGPLPRILHLHIPILFTSLSTSSSSSSSFACNDRQHLLFSEYGMCCLNPPPPPTHTHTHTHHYHEHSHSTPLHVHGWLLGNKYSVGACDWQKPSIFMVRTYSDRIQLSKTHSMAW